MAYQRAVGEFMSDPNIVGETDDIETVPMCEDSADASFKRVVDDVKSDIISHKQADTIPKRSWSGRINEFM